MNSVLLSSPALLLLLLGAAAGALLCGAAKRLRPLWMLLCCGCTAALVLAGLVLGAGLEELTAALLAISAAALLALGKGGKTP